MEKGTTGRVALERLRQWREYALKSQEQLSADSGVSRDTIIELELGRRKANYSTVGRLAKGLGITPQQLVNSSPDMLRP